MVDARSMRWWPLPLMWVLAACAPVEALAAAVSPDRPPATTAVASPNAGQPVPAIAVRTEIISAVSLSRVEYEVRTAYEQFSTIDFGCWLRPDDCHRALLTRLAFSPGHLLEQVDERSESGQFAQRNANPDYDYEVIESVDLDRDGTVAFVNTCRVDGALLFTVDPEDPAGVRLDDAGVYGYRQRNEMRRDEDGSWKLWSRARFDEFDGAIENRCPPRSPDQ